MYRKSFWLFALAVVCSSHSLEAKNTNIPDELISYYQNIGVSGINERIGYHGSVRFLENPAEIGIEGTWVLAFACYSDQSRNSKDAKNCEQIKSLPQYSIHIPNQWIQNEKIRQIQKQKIGFEIALDKTSEAVVEQNNTLYVTPVDRVMSSDNDFSFIYGLEGELPEYFFEKLLNKKMDYSSVFMPNCQILEGDINLAVCSTGVAPLDISIILMRTNS